ncbi:MAG: response regulator [Chloroflexota bacterium]
MIDYGDTVFAVERLRLKQQQRRKSSATATANGNTPEGSAVTTSQATILIIDDSDAMVEVLTNLLQHFDCNVLSALNARDGLAAYERNQDKVALVILDMNMPLMDGAEALAKLRQINPHVPAIVSSSIPEAEARRRCRQQGQEISHYLAKPYTLEHARQMIGELLGR